MEPHLYRKLKRGGASDERWCSIAANEGATLNAAKDDLLVTKESTAHRLLERGLGNSVQMIDCS